MPNENAVANPPAGGPQEQASTNDDNANPILADKPWVVAVSAHGQVGVVDRYATEGEAQTAATARRSSLPGTTEVTVVKENDPDKGLPNLVAEKEAKELGSDDEGDTKPADAKPSAPARPASAPTPPK